MAPHPKPLSHNPDTISSSDVVADDASSEREGSEDAKKPGGRSGRSNQLDEDASPELEVSKHVDKPGGKSGSRRRQLPPETVRYLQEWMLEHCDHPYPNDKEKAKIIEDTGIEMKQLKFWFVNNRRRYWRPMVETWMKKKGKSNRASVGPRSTPRYASDPRVLAPAQLAAGSLWTPPQPLPQAPVAPLDISLMHPSYLWVYLAKADGQPHPPIW